MKSDYSIIEGDEGVSICYKNKCDYYDAFIDIFVNVDNFPSPFKDVEDAKLFAEIVVKLLEVVTNGTG